MLKNEKIKEKTSYLKMSIFILIVTCSIILLVQGKSLLFNEPKLLKKFATLQQKNYAAKISEKNQELKKYQKQQRNDIKTNKLYSSNAILLDLSDKQVLMERNSEDKIYPASLTKIMTAVVVIDTVSDLNKTIKLSSDIFPELYNAQASMAGFLPNENVKIIDLLYGVMLPSGAECCIGLANEIAGSEKNFVKMMNEKAVKLGMTNTHFSNSTGLQDSQHYTTVKDLAVLLQYALQKDVFREIYTSSRYSTKPTNLHPNGITFSNTMFKYMDHTDIVGGKILGGKTGYTEEAGLCLASLAVVNDKDYVLVTTGASGNHQTKQFHILDAFNVYNQIGK
ncbi:serine hydrolase [Clostridium sp. OS1-26]|uniref:D-alanyl-D-alanine carboxypeptidase family protein n=1 Tax=Clostridium sp. OS1-26 TaxID=3070681 RepID=UPI0027E1756B|nr:serine hydrolase [Clostridium sp. OS1-26]WML34563.1 D-alanyl-D-alanine carboxypeptidase [Clostridium sp. OS1-26]